MIGWVGGDFMPGHRLLLQLTPKRDRDRQFVNSITLWINEASWMPMRQEIEEVTTRQTLTIDYEGAARNLNLNPDFFKSSWPRGTPIRGRPRSTTADARTWTATPPTSSSPSSPADSHWP